MCRNVKISCCLLIALTAVVLLLSSDSLYAKIFTIGGSVIAKTGHLTPDSGMDARGMKLMLANFTGVDLSEADFSGADLRRANFVGANLEGANFIGADLRGANFSGANLDGANVSRADLRGAMGFQVGRDTVLANTILPDGQIFHLNLTHGETLVVRNYDVVRDGTCSGVITLKGSVNVNDGNIVFVVDNQEWNSVIRLEKEVIPSIRNLNVHIEAAHTLVNPNQSKIQPFFWEDLSSITHGNVTYAVALSTPNTLVVKY